MKRDERGGMPAAMTGEEFRHRMVFNGISVVTTTLSWMELSRAYALSIWERILLFFPCLIFGIAISWCCYFVYRWWNLRR